MKATYENLLTVLRRSPGAYDAVVESDLKFDWSVGDSALKTADAIRAAGRIRKAYRIAAAVMAQEDEIEEGLYGDDGLNEDIFALVVELADGRDVDPRRKITVVPGGHVSTVRSPRPALGGKDFETAFLPTEGDLQFDERFTSEESAIEYHDALVEKLTTTPPPQGGPASAAESADLPKNPANEPSLPAVTSSAVPQLSEPDPNSSSATTTAATESTPALDPAGELAFALFFFSAGTPASIMPVNAADPKVARRELRIAERRVYVAPESAGQEWLRLTAAAFSKGF